VLDVGDSDSLDRDDSWVEVPAFPVGRWIKQARCRGEDVSLFFPANGVRPKEALEMCEGCCVRSQCLEWALVNNTHFGVWGGMTERQRFAEKRRRREAEED